MKLIGNTVMKLVFYHLGLYKCVSMLHKISVTKKYSWKLKKGQVSLKTLILKIFTENIYLKKCLEDNSMATIGLPVGGICLCTLGESKPCYETAGLRSNSKL